MPASSAFCSNCPLMPFFWNSQCHRLRFLGIRFWDPFIKDPLGIDAFVWQSGWRGSILDTEMQVWTPFHGEAWDSIHLSQSIHSVRNAPKRAGSWPMAEAGLEWLAVEGYILRATLPAVGAMSPSLEQDPPRPGLVIVPKCFFEIQHLPTIPLPHTHTRHTNIHNTHTGPLNKHTGLYLFFPSELCNITSSRKPSWFPPHPSLE